jgi:hypothetical protein
LLGGEGDDTMYGSCDEDAVDTANGGPGEDLAVGTADNTDVEFPLNSCV